jgi:hypothetical protein
MRQRHRVWLVCFSLGCALEATWFGHRAWELLTWAAVEFAFVVWVTFCASVASFVLFWIATSADAVDPHVDIRER